MARSKAHTVMRHKSEHRKKRGSERVGGGRRDDRSKGRGKKEERKKKGIREYGGGGGDHIEDDLRSFTIISLLSHSHMCSPIILYFDLL